MGRRDFKSVVQEFGERGVVNRGAPNVVKLKRTYQMLNTEVQEVES